MARKKQGRDQKRTTRYMAGGMTRMKAGNKAKKTQVARGMGAAIKGGKFSRDG
jgi:hypothetical protein